VEIPSYSNASYAHAWIETAPAPGVPGVLITDTHEAKALPFNLTFSTYYDTVTLKVDYYIFIQYGVGVSQMALLNHEDYTVNVTQLWMLKP
jgi:hypothetical protein